MSESYVIVFKSNAKSFTYEETRRVEGINNIRDKKISIINPSHLNKYYILLSFNKLHFNFMQFSDKFFVFYKPKIKCFEYINPQFYMATSDTSAIIFDDLRTPIFIHSTGELQIEYIYKEINFNIKDFFLNSHKKIKYTKKNLFNTNVDISSKIPEGYSLCYGACRIKAQYGNLSVGISYLDTNKKRGNATACVIFSDDENKLISISVDLYPHGENIQHEYYNELFYKYFYEKYFKKYIKENKDKSLIVVKSSDHYDDSIINLLFIDANLAYKEDMLYHFSNQRLVYDNFGLGILLYYLIIDLIKEYSSFILYDIRYHVELISRDDLYALIQAYFDSIARMSYIEVTDLFLICRNMTPYTLYRKMDSEQTWRASNPRNILKFGSYVSRSKPKWAEIGIEFVHSMRCNNNGTLNFYTTSLQKKDQMDITPTNCILLCQDDIYECQPDMTRVVNIVFGHDNFMNFLENKIKFKQKIKVKGFLLINENQYLSKDVVYRELEIGLHDVKNIKIYYYTYHGNRWGELLPGRKGNHVIQFEEGASIHSVRIKSIKTYHMDTTMHTGIFQSFDRENNILDIHIYREHLTYNYYERIGMDEVMIIFE